MKSFKQFMAEADPRFDSLPGGPFQGPRWGNEIPTFTRPGGFDPWSTDPQWKEKWDDWEENPWSTPGGEPPPMPVDPEGEDYEEWKERYPRFTDWWDKWFPDLPIPPIVAPMPDAPGLWPWEDPDGDGIPSEDDDTPFDHDRPWEKFV